MSNGWEIEKADLQAQFERALQSRDIIGQAKGILMHRLSIDADAAFEVLKDVSNRQRRKVHDVALTLIAHISE